MTSPSPYAVDRTVESLMQSDHETLQELEGVLSDVPAVQALAELVGELFVSVSFCVDPAAATPYVPIPLRMAGAGKIRICPEPTRLLAFQRAMLNVSRSMQVLDEPHQGVLASVHRTGTIWDSSQPTPLEAQNLLDLEEQAIGATGGMIYVPILSSRHEGSTIKAQTVIVLWWASKTVPSRDQQAALVSSVQSSSSVARFAHSHELRLQDGAAIRIQPLVFLQYLVDRFRGGSPALLAEVKTLFHGLEPFLSQEHHSQQCELDRFLSEIFDPSRDPWFGLPTTSDFAIFWRQSPTAPPEPITTPAQRSTWTDLVSSLVVPDHRFGGALLAEAFDSVGHHGAELASCVVSCSQRFLRLRLEMSRSVDIDLHEYFSIRRGLFCRGAARSGLGIGLALHSLSAETAGAFRTLYVPPEGGMARIEVAIPVVAGRTK